MFRPGLAAASAALTFASLAPAAAAPGWKPYATAVDSGEYGAFVHANATVLHPKQLAVRISRPGDLSISLLCDFTAKAHPAGKVYLLVVGRAQKCDVIGGATTDQAGSVKLELLRKG
jgi:hypothetical protein